MVFSALDQEWLLFLDCMFTFMVSHLNMLLSAEMVTNALKLDISSQRHAV